MPEMPQVKMPYHVETTDGAFHSGYVEEAQAKHAVDTANKGAEALGVKARYKKVDAPFQQ